MIRARTMCEAACQLPPKVERAAREWVFDIFAAVKGDKVSAERLEQLVELTKTLCGGLLARAIVHSTDDAVECRTSETDVRCLAPALASVLRDFTVALHTLTPAVARRRLTEGRCRRFLAEVEERLH
jgi:hypothetical protein